MKQSRIPIILGFTLVLTAVPRRAHAQIVVIDDVILLTSRQKKQQETRTHQYLDPPGGENLLPSSPGADTPRLGEETTSTPPLPGVLSISGRRIGQYGGTNRLRLTAPLRLPTEEVPLSGPLELPVEQDDGPQNGLSLDAAIDRLLAANEDLAAKYQDIPKARADTLSAGLRGNPFLFVSAGNIPYGRYSPQRPGAANYDVTVIQPFDVSGKHKHGIRVAEQATEVLEAQYQDAVRQEIDRLYNAYVNVLGAREAVRAARAGVTRLEDLVKTTRDLVGRKQRTRSELAEVTVRKAGAEVAIWKAEAALLAARRNLATLLAIPPEQADELCLHGSLRVHAPALPCTEELAQLALQTRPDLAAYRLGVERAQADVRLARAEAIDDAFLFYTPYTATDFSPQNKQSASGWGLGVLMSVPLFSRNQGGIARAGVNATQTRIELSGLQRQLANEVRYAATEYAFAQEVVGHYEQEILADSRSLRDEEYRRFTAGQEPLDAFLEVQKDYNDTIRHYLAALVRRRRGMLKLNTAVGQRILP
jgi:cobalt-zinc-cadmium efflux system outer membrane protein